VKIHVEFFCVVMPCIVVVGYQRFRGPCCLNTKRCHNPRTSTWEKEGKLLRRNSRTFKVTCDSEVVDLEPPRKTERGE